MVIDLLATPTGELNVFNPYDHQVLFNFSGYGTMAVPTGFNAADESTWSLATVASYNITVSGPSTFLGTMTICNDASNVPSAHACGYWQPSYNGYIYVDPGASTLHFSGHMADASGNAHLLFASLTVGDGWFRSDPYVEELTTTPIPGAALLFATGLSLLLLWRRYANRHA